MQAVMRKSAVLVVFALAAVLLLVGLDRIPIWRDEVTTALYGRSILDHGIPVAQLEGNYIPIDGNAQGVATGITWLQFYVAALPQAIDKDNVWLLRLPFALAGLLSIVLAWFFGRRWLGGRAAVVGALLLTLNVTFLLHMRTARYYSLSVALTMGMLLCLDGMTRGRLKATAWFAAFAALLFYSSPLAFLVVMPAMAVVLGVMRWMIPELPLRQWFVRMAVTGVAIVIVVIPWLLYAGHDQNPGWSVARTFINVSFYAIWTSSFVISLPLLAGLLWCALMPPKGVRAWLIRCALILCFVVATLALMEVIVSALAVVVLIIGSLSLIAVVMLRQPALRNVGVLVVFIVVLILTAAIASGSILNVRYVLPMLPVLFLVAGWALSQVIPSNRWLALCIILVVLGAQAVITFGVPFWLIKTTTGASSIPDNLVSATLKPRCMLCEFGGEIVRDEARLSYEKVIADYFVERADNATFIVGQWDYLHYPLMFYTSALASPRVVTRTPDWIVTHQPALDSRIQTNIGFMDINTSRYALVRTATALLYNDEVSPDPVRHRFRHTEAEDVYFFQKTS